MQAMSCSPIDLNKSKAKITIDCTALVQHRNRQQHLSALSDTSKTTSTSKAKVALDCTAFMQDRNCDQGLSALCEHKNETGEAGGDSEDGGDRYGGDVGSRGQRHGTRNEKRRMERSGRVPGVAKKSHLANLAKLQAAVRGKLARRLLGRLRLEQAQSAARMRLARREAKVE